MLIDGLKLTPNAPITNSKLAAGTSLPTTNLVVGLTFLLTAQSGDDAPGVYVYRDGAWAGMGGLSGIEAPEGSGLSVDVEAGQVVISISAAMTPYDIAAFVASKPEAGAKVCKLRVVRPFNLPANLTGSYASAETAGTVGAAQFLIKKNGTEVGSFSFAVGATTATFVMASAQAFVAGDSLEIVAPAVQNAALAGISFTLAGNLR